MVGNDGDDCGEYVNSVGMVVMMMVVVVVVMIMLMVMMAIWTGMWRPGHKARRQIHTEVNMALKVSLYWPTGHP